MAPRPGDVLEIDGAASAQVAGHSACLMRVIAVSPGATYEGWVWLTGYVLGRSGTAVERREILPGCDVTNLEARDQMTVFFSAAVREELMTAQVQLDHHTTSSADGRCPSCGSEDPCPIRRAALRMFGRYGCLSRRWPGASRPERVRLAGWSGWLRHASDIEPD